MNKGRSPTFQWIFPHGGKIWNFRSYRKNNWNAYPIRNFTLNNFILCVRFNIRYGSRDMEVSSGRFSLSYHARCIVNVQTLDAYIWHTIRNMETITVSKFIQTEISNMIGFLIFFSTWSDDPHFAKIGGNPALKWELTPPSFHASNLRTFPTVGSAYPVLHRSIINIS